MEQLFRDIVTGFENNEILISMSLPLGVRVYHIRDCTYCVLNPHGLLDLAVAYYNGEIPCNLTEIKLTTEGQR